MHPSANTMPAPEPWYRQRWPWLLMLGPFLVVIAGGVTLWLALMHPDALVVDDYYKQGKAINRDLRRDHAAAVLKLSAALHYDPAGGRLAGTLQSAGQPLSGSLNLKLVHSTQPGKDLAFTAQADGAGAFSVALPMLEKARWRVLVQDSAGEWRLSGDWLWPQQRSVEIRAAQN
jgi:hypothetical protein